MFRMGDPGSIIESLRAAKAEIEGVTAIFKDAVG
jgi:hypothetical protein